MWGVASNASYDTFQLKCMKLGGTRYNLEEMMYFEGKCQMYESKGGQGLDVFWNWYFYGNVYTQGGVCCFNIKNPNISNVKKPLKTVMYRTGLTASDGF